MFNVLLVIAEYLLIGGFTVFFVWLIGVGIHALVTGQADWRKHLPVDHPDAFDARIPTAGSVVVLAFLFYFFVSHVTIPSLF